MPVFSGPVRVDKPKSGQGHGGVHPPAYTGGGGGSGPGDGPSDYERRLRRARLALVLGFVSISMLFVIVTAVFLIRHSTVVLDSESRTYVHQWIPAELPVRLLLFNTLILALGSLTIELGRRSIAREMSVAPMRVIPGIAWEGESRIPWLAITSFLGIVFLIGQWKAWSLFRAHGFHVFTAGSSPFFYLLTGTHAVHLAAGILILLYAVSTSLLHSAIEHRRIVVEVASWYWHFMGVLWVYVFVLLQLGR